MEDKASEASSLAQDNTHNNTRKLVEEREDSLYQNQMEELKIKQKIRNLESEIEMLARRNVADKIQGTLNETRNHSNETTTEGHLLDIEV
jgi:glucose-6-phosphate-specific signal transduction histidine kinase